MGGGSEGDRCNANTLISPTTFIDLAWTEDEDDDTVFVEANGVKFLQYIGILKDTPE